MDPSIHKKIYLQPENPRKNAGLLSRLTFYYMIKIIKETSKKNCGPDNIYQALPEFKSEYLGLTFEKLWLKSKCEFKSSSSKQLLMILIKMFYKKFFSYYVIYLIVRILVTYFEPILAGKIVAHFQHPNPNIYYLGFALIVINLVYFFIYQQYIQATTEIALQIAISLSSMIYRKTLRLSKPNLINQSKIGNAVTLITKDVFCFDMLLYMFANGILAIILIIVQITSCCIKLGWVGMLPGLIAIGVVCIEILLGVQSWKSRLKECFYASQRLSTLKEVFAMIRPIKMLAWETFFISKIDYFRMKEVENIFRLLGVRIGNMLIGKSFSIASFFITVLVYTAINKNISAETLYYLMSSISVIKIYTNYLIPFGIASSAEALASLKRLAEFLSLEDHDTLVLNPNNQFNESTEKPLVKTFNFTLSNDLYSHNWEINKGLVVVTGSLESESLLLKAIAGEFGPLRGLEVKGSISYVGQDSWLFPGTIKNNILFGQSFKKDRYMEVLQRCALLYDLNQFERGDETLVTDEGINLSTGQQIRIQLARAIYQQKQIYLFDSILNCLDARTSEFIFQKVFKEFLKEYICILINDNSEYLKYANKVLVLKKESVTEIINSNHIKLNNELNEEYFKIDKDITVDEENCDESTKLLHQFSTKNAYQELNNTGKMLKTIYQMYCKFGGGFWIIVLLITAFSITESLYIVINLFISKWINNEEELFAFNKTFNSTSSESYKKLIQDRNQNFRIYIGCFFIYIIFHIFAATTWIFLIKTASKNIHKALVRSILCSKMNFFCTNSMGVILNRFSKDMNNLDEALPICIYGLCNVGFDIIGVFVMIAITRWITLVPISIVICGGILYMNYILLSITTKVKRLESALHSPLVGYLNGTFKGLTTIKLLGRYDLLIQEYDFHQDRFSSAFFCVLCTQRMLNMVLHFACVGFLAIIVFYFIINGKSTPGEVGLGIGQALACIILINYSLTYYMEMEAQMTSLERISHFLNLNQDNLTVVQLLTKNWPPSGAITIKNLNLSYNNEHVLKNVNMQINAKEKVAIIGRTGSGKSSLIYCLFRLFKYTGDILIDGVNIERLETSYLRKRFGIISRDSLLFTGTLRENLDPFGEHKDSDILNTFNLLSMEYPLSGNKFLLDNLVQPNRLSLPEKLLICLVRILLAKPKILVLDEAHSLFEGADAILTRVINRFFVNHTVIIVTHSLKLAQKMDKVFVLKAGCLSKFESPQNLLKNTNLDFAKII